MKWLMVALCCVSLFASQVSACGGHQAVQVFQAPAVQSSAVYAQPACAVQAVQVPVVQQQVPVVQQQVYQAVQVPVQAPVIVQSAYSSFAVPVVQQRVVRSAPVRQSSRVRVKQRSR